MAGAVSLRRRAGAAAIALAVGALSAHRAGGEEGMFDPRFREGSGGDVLVAGETRLLRGHLDAFVDLTEAAFDLAWSAPAEQELRDAVEVRFGEWSPAERQGFLDLVTPATGLRDKGRGGDLDGLKAGVRAFWIALDRRIHAAPREKAHRVLTEGLERRQRAVWKGVPAVHGSAADAWLEATALLVALGRNERWVPTEGQRATLLEELDVGLHGQPEPVRERLRGFHRTWLLAKARWDAASPARRFALRWHAVQLLARLLPPERPLTVTQGPEAADYAREAGRVAGRTTPYDAWSNAARQPEAVLEVLTKGLELPETTPEHVLLFR